MHIYEDKRAAGQASTIIARGRPARLSLEVDAPLVASDNKIATGWLACRASENGFEKKHEDALTDDAD
ncbi:hypothetical protein [Burkholderia oklahomensis]|uniref:hypothetical protein n=1 Tax=Burkholderia oklahomensis TaxID=342113 RepID=UPI000AD0CE70|nr:hypothetical protein [Burkholderia oklahomensis]MBI0362044.1 hypothetical protein [Burkholderia oklahomensis]